MITLYIVRHGTTEANAKKIVQGQTDTPLTQQGKVDAAALAKKLEEIRFDAIYSSDLGRAFMTEFIIAKLDHEEDKIHTDAKLRELDFGDEGNHKKDQVLADFPQYQTDADFVFPDGESFNQMKQRVTSFLVELATKHEGETILIVTHSCCIRAIKSWAKNIDPDLHLLQSKVPHDYVSIIKIEKDSVQSYTEASN
ncbi:MAG: broad specificity phosphatase PhoE [Candidatus Woesearchaeota archaeon]|jgi:broad specificity phosphatase PhoE